MKDRMQLREWLPLLGLTFSAFIFNTSEFMPIGLLTDIADTFRMSEAGAGLMITLYALVVMLMSLPLMLLASKLDFRKLLLGTILLFGICQILSATAQSFAMLMLSRIGVACTHAIFWSIASPLAVRVVSEKFHSLALSLIAPGMSFSTLLMPLGLYTPFVDGIGHFDMSVLIPAGIGALVTVICLAKAVNALFDHFYSFAFHGIIGIVIAATVMIIPFSSFWNGATALPNVICLMVGVVAAVLLDRFNSSVTVE